VHALGLALVAIIDPLLLLFLLCRAKLDADAYSRACDQE
jgi:hypothetical protein